jgi:hypothetical protein
VPHTPKTVTMCFFERRRDNLWRFVLLRQVQCRI